MKIVGWAREIGRDGRSSPVPVYAELQVEHDGLRLGTCLAIAKRLERFPNFTMQGMLTDLTETQWAAVRAFGSGAGASK